MSRVLVRSAIAAAALSGVLLSAGSVRADARPAACASALDAQYAAMAGRDVLCRPAARALHRRPVLGAAPAPRLAVPSRYVSLLILGVGY